MAAWVCCHCAAGTVLTPRSAAAPQPWGNSPTPVYGRGIAICISPKWAVNICCPPCFCKVHRRTPPHTAASHACHHAHAHAHTNTNPLPKVPNTCRHCQSAGLFSTLRGRKTFRNPPSVLFGPVWFGRSVPTPHSHRMIALPATGCPPLVCPGVRRDRGGGHRPDHTGWQPAGADRNGCAAAFPRHLESSVRCVLARQESHETMSCVWRAGTEDSKTRRHSDK